MRQERWLRRLVRGIRPDRNPLRRRSDRVETYLLAGLFVMAAGGAPFAAHAASQATYSAALRVQQAQLATSHQVRAVVTQAAGSTGGAYALSSRVPAQAAWTSVTGAKRTGQIMVESGTPKGASVAVWTNAAGDLITPPLKPSQVAGQANMAALGTVTGIGVLYLCEAGIVRYVLYRRRMAAWEADWEVTARTWNRQRW